MQQRPAGAHAIPADAGHYRDRRAANHCGTLPLPGHRALVKHIIVRAQVAGVVIARPFVEGTDVAKGTLLYEIDTTQYAAALRNATGTLDDAKAKLANANINLNRVKPLLAERAVAQSTVDSAEQILRQAEADVAGSRVPSIRPARATTTASCVLKCRGGWGSRISCWARASRAPATR